MSEGQVFRSQTFLILWTRIYLTTRRWTKPKLQAKITSDQWRVKLLKAISQRQFSNTPKQMCTLAIEPSIRLKNWHLRQVTCQSTLVIPSRPRSLEPQKWATKAIQKPINQSTRTTHDSAREIKAREPWDLSAPREQHRASLSHHQPRTSSPVTVLQALSRPNLIWCPWARQ